jgi:hypothetical protein
MAHYLTCKMLSGQPGYYCGQESHAYLGSVPFTIYRDLGKPYATADEARAAMRSLPIQYHGSPNLGIEEAA